MITTLKKAMYFNKLKNNFVKCNLCRKHCIIKEGVYGDCNARKNIDGNLYSMVYGRIASLGIDPIEKKPLFHFFPGEQTLSYATSGCNFHCKFCQNWEISQQKPKNVVYEEISPEGIVNIAKNHSLNIISHTYTEPTVFYEYAFEVAEKSNLLGMKNVFVTNGYIEYAPLKKISKFLDAANIDLKGFNEKFYRNVCGAELDEVLKSIKLYKKYKIHIELTNLVIPQKNDNFDEIKQMCEWIVKELGKNVPLHFSAFFPSYKMRSSAPTNPKTLYKAKEIAVDSGIRYVYAGNIDAEENTYCYKCNHLLIKRRNFKVLLNNLVGGRCPNCGAKQYFVF